jgi:hypothetical protein
MREINEIIEYLERVVLNNKIDGKTSALLVTQRQLDNANKVKAKLQGAIDLFKDIEKL